MNRVSVSEIQRNLHKLSDFDIVEVIDKKRDKVKGYFLESKYAVFVEALAQKIQNQQKQERRSLKGILHREADLETIKAEEGAWKNHVIEKYRADD